MPGFYPPGEYDVAGTIVGVVEREKILDGSRVRAGDVALGLPSAGPPHQRLLARPRSASSGRSRRRRPTACRARGARRSETRCWLRTSPIARRSSRCSRRTSCTRWRTSPGGGFYDNIPRVVPERLEVILKSGAWPVPPVFDVIRARREKSPSRKCTASSTWESAWWSSSRPKACPRSPDSGRQTDQRWYAIGNVRAGDRQGRRRADSRRPERGRTCPTGIASRFS